MQEMLAPLTLYKEAAEKAENEYLELSKNTNIFEYLRNNVDPDSIAGKIYTRYANDLAERFSDFSRNGLNMNNKAGLLDLKRRYAGEIGQLEKANTELQELLKHRNALIDSGKTMLYADENPTLDSMLEGSNFNRYGISVEDIEKLGEEYGKQLSSRNYYSPGDAGPTLNGYYRKWKEAHGISGDDIPGFINSKEIQDLTDSVLIQRGADNLGIGSPNYMRARNAFLNSMYKGIIYEESTKPIEDKEAITPLDMLLNGVYKDGNNNLVFDPDRSLAVQKEKAKAEARANAKTSGGSSGSGGSKRSTSKQPMYKDTIDITWDGDPNKDGIPQASKVASDDVDLGTPTPYTELPQYAKDLIDKTLVKDGENIEDIEKLYDFYITDYEDRLFLRGDQRAKLRIKPRGISTTETESGETNIPFNFGIDDNDDNE
jgi:hypothetical protein